MEPYQAKGLNRTSRKLAVWRDVVDGQDAVRVKFGEFSCVAIFLMAWLAFWSFGLVKVGQELFSRPFDWGNMLKMLPFVAVAIFMGGFVLFLVFGHTLVTFFRGGCTVFKGIGSIGRTKKFVISPLAKVKVSKKEVHRSKGGTVIYHTLLIDSPSDPCSPREIYADTDAGVVMILRDIAVDVCQCAEAGAAEGGSAAARAAVESEAEQEAKDRMLLSGMPPKKLTVTRDMEGRIVATCRGSSWIATVVHLAAAGGIGFAVYKAFGVGNIPNGNPWPIPVVVVLLIAANVASVSLLYAIFGRRKLVIDHGNGETLSGLAGIGSRKRFMCGYGSQIDLEDGDMVINGTRMQTISIKQPDGSSVQICTTWPNEVKPYLAAVLRHPESVVVAPTF